MSGAPLHRKLPSRLRWLVAVLCLTHAASALAWVLTISGGSRRLFLQVGVGTMDAVVGTVNLVELNVAPALLGNSTSMPMTTNSTQAASPLDGYTVCVPSAGQIYVGGYYRRAKNSKTSSATLQVTSPSALTSGSDVIPITAISWTSTALGDPAADIPGGAFAGGTQFLRTITANTYVENCFTFSYANTAVPAAGTYTGRVTYTLTSL